jgi:hypothetical protein
MSYFREEGVGVGVGVGVGCGSGCVCDVCAKERECECGLAWRQAGVGRGGIEPPKATPTDLQSAPFDRSGISPRWVWVWVWNWKCECGVWVLGAGVISNFQRTLNRSRWTGSNRRPADYKSAALPTELHRRRGCGCGCGCGCVFVELFYSTSTSPYKIDS